MGTLGGKGLIRSIKAFFLILFSTYIAHTLLKDYEIFNYFY